MADDSLHRAEEDSGLPEPDWEAIGNRLFAETWESYAGPELQRRRAAGEWPEDEPLYRWQVLLNDDGPEVRFNREVRGSIIAVAGRAIEAGQEVAVDDVTGITDYAPLPEETDVPHVTAFLHAGGWSLAFEFHRSHPAGTTTSESPESSSKPPATCSKRDTCTRSRTTLFRRASCLRKRSCCHAHRRLSSR